MRIKKHIQEQDYLTWSEHFPLFSALNTAEKEALQERPEQFLHTSCIRLFPDPFIATIFPPDLDTHPGNTTIVCGTDEQNQQIAHRLKARLAEKWGFDLKILVDSQDLDFWNIDTPVILVGGVQHNHWSKRLAQKLQLGVFNQNFPGKNGWAATTYQGIEQGLGIRFVLCGDKSVDYFTDYAISADTKQLQWVHEVHLDADLPEIFHDFSAWMKHSAKRAEANLSPLSSDLNTWVNSDHKQPYREIFAKVLFAQRNRPIVYNAALLDIGLVAIRYYQFTGDMKSLEVFREMLWGFWDYLNSTEPNIYISDMDFRLGQICSYWSWVEHHPAITAEERKKFRQLLLAAMRMAYDYYLRNWARRDTPLGVRHNHQTFKGRCLLWGWRYFHQFNIADTELWKQDADTVFSYMDAARSKYSENANNYETLVPEHLLTWYEVSGKDIDTDFQRALALFAYREWALTDNFYYRVEYGDCVVSFARKKPFQVAPWLTNDSTITREVRALEQIKYPFKTEIPAAIYGFSEIQDASTVPDTSQLMIGWIRIPLEPKLESQYPLQGSSDERFDKLVWRSGWHNESAYLALEGFGNEKVSHAHNATNSIIRANVGGRIWLVGNVYGKKINVTSAAKAFSSRERGPRDHNMLILRDEEGNLIVPPVNSLLIDEGNFPIPFTVIELPNYGDFTWRRHIFILQELGFIIVDKVIPQPDKSTSTEASLEWNILGSIQKNDAGAIIEQSGISMQFQQFGAVKIDWDHNASASWHRVMKSHEYPHTAKPLEKCILTLPPRNSNNARYVVSNFCLQNREIDIKWDAAKHFLQIYSPNLSIANFSKTKSGWGEFKTDRNSLQVSFSS